MEVGHDTVRGIWYVDLPLQLNFNDDSKFETPTDDVESRDFLKLTGKFRFTCPGGDDFIGPAGVRELVRMAPPTLRRTTRGERVDGNTVTVEALTRVPGIFASFTTWTIETDGERITRVAFSRRSSMSRQPGRGSASSLQCCVSAGA